MLLLALFCVSGIWAEDVTPEQALEQAQNFLNKQQAASGKPRKAQGAQKQLTLQGKVSGLYVFDVKDSGGFVIVSNDDRTYPILGFSETDNIDINNIPDNMRAWLQGYANEIAWVQQQHSTVAPPKSDKVGTHPTTAVTPLCTSTWNQDTPYNNLCPTYSSYGSTAHCATGCVATAMAQVMYYHKWPNQSTKTIPGYSCTDYTLSSLPVTTFDWAHMKNSYSGSYTSTEATAVATLMKYCGYGVKMDYGPSSGAYTEDVAIALREYFDYNPYTTRFVSRSSYTYANWTDLIYHEVSHNRPVCYGGLSDGGGHEFVCDGYKFESNTDFFHINWGWGGLSDNYFVLSALDPDQQGIGGSTSTDGFHYGQDAVIGIQKSTASGTTAPVSPNVIDLTLNSVTLSSSAVEPSTTVAVTFNVTNNSTDPYDGDIWLCLREDDTNYLLDCETTIIPAGATQDIVISYTPRQTGSYTFVFCYINANGEYVSVDEPTATLSVVENLYNGVVPVYGYWADNYSRSQFIIAEANIEEMLYGTINGVTFTAVQPEVSWGAAKFDVYVKEVEESTISALKDWSTLEKVYSGSLSIVDNKMTINFTTPYVYMGGNLLIGVNQTVSGSYVKCSWIGENVTGVSVGGYGTSISQQNFLPRTDFDYTPSENPPLIRPKNLAVSYTSGTEATVTWTSDAPAFDIEVNGDVTEDVSNPCTLTDLELATTYYIKVRAKDEERVSEWTEPVNFTTNLSYQTCQIRLELTDLFGDGWGDAAIKIVDVLTGTELGTFTNTDAAGKNEAQIYYAEVPDDRDIEFQWVNGSYDHECVYAAYDVNGNLIFSGSRRMTTPVTYHVDCSAVTSVVLANNEDNAALIESLDGTTGCEVTLQGRTLYKDGTWNTICLPFNVTLADSPLAGADVRALNNATLEGESVTLNFTEEGAITTLIAGMPYIIKWASSDNLVDPVFTGVTIDKAIRDVTCVLEWENPDVYSKAITFKGTYDYTAFTETDKSILFVGADNKFYYPMVGATIGAQRAFFQLYGIIAEEGNAVKQFVLAFGDDDATGLKDLNNLKDVKGTWYTLEGVKLSGKPTVKGIYILNNKKVTVK